MSDVMPSLTSFSAEEVEANRREEIAERSEGTAHRRGTTPPPVRRMKAVACEFKFAVKPEFRDLLPPLTKEEYSKLEENIIANGCRDPLVVWNDTIIDGHNRYEICRRNNITPYVIQMEFGGEDEVTAWIIKNAFGRRNLTAIQRSRLALQLEPLIAKKAKENQIAAQNNEAGRAVRQKSDKQVAPIDTKKELAKIAGVSHDTIHRVKVIDEQGSDELKARLERKEVSINRAYRELRPVTRGNEEPAAPTIPKCRQCRRPCRWCETLATRTDGVAMDCNPTSTEPPIGAVLNSVVQQLNNKPVVTTTDVMGGTMPVAADYHTSKEMV